MPKDKYVLNFWRAHGVVPSDIEPDDYHEIADALGADAPLELVRTLRRAG